MLAIIVPPIVEHIVKNSNIGEEKAISCFYRKGLVAKTPAFRHGDTATSTIKQYIGSQKTSQRE